MGVMFRCTWPGPMGLENKIGEELTKPATDPDCVSYM
jgi:hypothetical protein